MRLVLLFWLIYKLFFPSEKTLGAKDFDFVFLDEIYSFSGSENNLFYPDSLWIARQPATHEFIFLHFATGIDFTQIKISPPNDRLILYTGYGQKIVPVNGNYFFRPKSDLLIFTYFPEKIHTANILLNKSTRKIALKADSLIIKKITFIKNDRQLPVFILRRHETNFKTKYVDLNSNLAVAFNENFFFELEQKPEYQSLLLTFRRNNKIKGSYYKFSDNTFSFKTVSSSLSIDKYFIRSALGTVLYKIPDSALVQPTDFDTTIILDIRYATTKNFTRTKLYPCARCWLRYEVAKDLLAAAKDFEDLGYRIVLFDCYRPISVQKKMWKVVPDINFVAPPSKGSMHNRGVAVDLSLADPNGHLVEMGTDYDYFGPEAAPSYRLLSSKALYFRQLLSDVMQLNNFKPIRTEWWHFYHLSYSKYNLIETDICPNK